MSKKDTVTIKITTNGNSYEIEKTKYDKLEALCEHARDTMTSPCVFHLISHICDTDAFETTKRTLIKYFERALKRQYKHLKQECPKTFIAYSIEFKETTQKEIDNDANAYKVGNSIWEITKQKLPFLHLHFYVIADCNKTIPTSFPHYAIQALDELNGLRASRYSKSRFDEVYKRLKGDYDDCVLRFLYIGKIEQKSEQIPYRNTFGTSRIS